MKKKLKLIGIDELSADSQSLFDAVNDARDLPCALISTSFLDQCLGSLLKAFCIKGNTTRQLLDPVSGALGTFANRTNACYCLGLIPKGTKNNLTILGEVRNRFAHCHLNLTFEDPEITDLCNSLELPAATGKTVDCETGEVQEHAKLDILDLYNHPRVRFTTVSILMCQTLLHCGRRMKGQERAQEIGAFIKTSP